MEKEASQVTKIHPRTFEVHGLQFILQRQRCLDLLQKSRCNSTFVHAFLLLKEVKYVVAMFSLVVLFLCAIANVLSGPAISLNQCKSGDDACTTAAAKAAYPLVLEANEEIGAEDLDPMYLSVIEGNLSILKFKLFNTTIVGFKSCSVDSAKYNEEESSAQVVILCPKFTMHGSYDIDGRLIVLPVKGNGDYSLESLDYKLKVDMELRTITKDGKSYRTVKTYKVEAEAQSGVSYDFRNLFNGQKDLADAVLKFANENWKEVANEVQDPVFMTSLKRIIKNANKYLKTLPIDEYMA
ncbi:circadian clock-controlled protein-like [Trichoplusia ni]|uniref:Circadian clock-controlled protein-like n=1 Tax=Trichoplusia ni TaxID=7111 RepID=A0A7E5WU38_TRINI|nr:circadian clock-controlled protein-like [Trichoplusia ni]